MTALDDLHPIVREAFHQSAAIAELAIRGMAEGSTASNDTEVFRQILRADGITDTDTQDALIKVALITAKAMVATISPPTPLEAALPIVGALAALLLGIRLAKKGLV